MKYQHLSKITVTVVTFFCLMAEALADTYAIEPGWVLGGAYTVGGDTVAQVEVVTIFDDYDTEELKAGGTFYFYGGYMWPIRRDGQGATALQLTLGYHFDFVTAGDDSVSFDRYPVDAMLYRFYGGWRFGPGITYHLSPTVDLKDAGGPEFSFDDSVGFIFEIGREISSFQYISLRYTDLDYSINGVDVDGSNIGLGFTAQF